MNTITKIGIISLITLSMAGIASADTSISVAPLTATKNLGETLNATVELSVQNDSVCVISGDISFANLSCQTIGIGTGVMAQTAPSCQSSHFVLGIPQCTSGAKTLFNIAALANVPGTGTISLTNVKAINQNNQVVSTSTGGSYTIQGVLSSSTSTSSGTTSGGTSGTTNTQNTAPAGQTPASGTENVAPTTEPVNPPTAAPAAVSATPAGNSFLASIGNAIFSKDAAWVLGILILLVIAYYIWKNFYKKNPNQ